VTGKAEGIPTELAITKEVVLKEELCANLSRIPVALLDHLKVADKKGQLASLSDCNCMFQG